MYTYTVETYRSDDTEHAYGVDKMDPGGGGTFMFHNVNQHYIAPGSKTPDRRSGTISVKIVREQPDGGLVLEVSETQAATPAAAPVTCVAFADTTVVCDPNRDVGAEITALAALLGKGFVDPARLDSARHWRVEAQGAYGTTADYTIVRNAAALLDIQEQGVRTDPGSPSKTTIDAAIEYDAARSLPTSLDESTVQRNRRGAVFETISTQTTLKLDSESPR